MNRSNNGDTPQVTEDIQRLEYRILALEKEISKLALTEEKAIKIFNLGFSSEGESDVWLDLHLPQGNFGYVIDFHTLLEHNYHSIT